MKKIPLSQNGTNKGKYCATVDDADYERLSLHRWCVLIGGKYKNVYAVRGDPNRKGQWIYMHHEVLPREPGLETDHINGRGLDNRATNLRNVTHAQNQANTHKRKPSASQYKGLFKHKQSDLWGTQIIFRGEKYSLGYFHKDQEAEAARAYDRAAIAFWGDSARTNFPAEEYSTEECVRPARGRRPGRRPA